MAIGDLLPRRQIALNTDGVDNLVRGKRVMVTGAGGSIGSELCRQIATFGPSDLILFERYENSLYAIVNDLANQHGDGPVVVHPIIGDVTDVARVHEIFARHRPHLVFHAAAHKHVPLMEANPSEATNNVVGTKTIAEASRDYGEGPTAVPSCQFTSHCTITVASCQGMRRKVVRSGARAKSP